MRIIDTNYIFFWRFSRPRGCALFNPKYGKRFSCLLRSSYKNNKTYFLIDTPRSIYILYACLFRDRPFNLQGRGAIVFFFRSEIFFRTTQELEYFFLSRKAQNFFPEFNIRLYDKNSESDYYFFPPPKIFSATLGIRIFFRKKP